MKETTIARAPSTKAVAMEQLRVVGLAVRREGLLLCTGLVIFGLIVAAVEDLQEQRVALEPEVLGYLAVLVALVAPLGVWKGERFFGESELWTLPVEHARHARLKIASGWVWLMVVVTFGVLVMAAGVLLVGGSLGVDETRLLVTDPDAPRFGATGPLVEARWVTQPWQWVGPFTAATAVYLASSAFLVGLRRPLYWAAGCWLAALAAGEVSSVDRLVWLASPINTVVRWFDLLASGGSESAQTLALLDSGERVRAWTDLPTMGSWAAATVIWLALASAAVWAGTRRHREGRGQ